MAGTSDAKDEAFASAVIVWLKIDFLRRALRDRPGGGLTPLFSAPLLENREFIVVSRRSTPN